MNSGSDIQNGYEPDVPLKRIDLNVNINKEDLYESGPSLKKSATFNSTGVNDLCLSPSLQKKQFKNQFSNKFEYKVEYSPTDLISDIVKISPLIFKVQKRLAEKLL